MQNDLVKKRINLKYLMENKDLVLINKEIDISNVFIETPDLNRLGLQLTGFFEKYDKRRIQLIGEAEKAYIDTLSDERKEFVYNKLSQDKIVCIVYAKNIEPDEIAKRVFTKYNIALLQTKDTTTGIMAELTRYLNVLLAPTITIHAVLIDVYGEGVLITGDSGIGKSEAALELIKRGHRLVADDSVEISKVSEVTLVGKAPEITKGLIEVRGIGIIDIIRCYGIQSILENQNINMIINLVDWKDGMDYDRLGDKIKKKEILGNEVDFYEIPIRSGRNVATIIEACAVNHRANLMGYNAAKLLEKRMIERNSK